MSSGSTRIRTVVAADDPLFVSGLVLILTGMAFKISAAPFHMWTPDVYEGAPTSVTAFMSAATKLAAAVVTYRLLVVAFPEQAEIWTISGRRARLRCRSRSATSPPWRSGTSSGCWRTRRSRMPASC